MEQESTGLFGGEASFWGRLDSATKVDELANKSMIKPDKPKPKESYRDRKQKKVVKDDVSTKGNI